MQGVPGATGGGKYVTRDDVYCNRVALQNGSGIAIAYCNELTDLPLTGSCNGPNPTIGVVGVSEPLGWHGATSSAVAGWRCGFFTLSGANVIVDYPYAAATICCVGPGPGNYP